jgi:uncharacterized protein (TIGR00251 family)
MIRVEDKSGAARFSIRVSPGASRSAVIGEYDDALKVSIAAPPEKGKANKALIEFLSQVLETRRASVSVVSGETSRDKVVAVEGFTAAALRSRLLDLCPKSRNP